MGKWLRRLGEFQDHGDVPSQESLSSRDITNNTGAIEASHGDKLDKSPEDAALLEQQNPDVVWRMAALRSQVPPCGPIGRLHLRLTSPTVTTAQFCRMCGDVLAENRRYRCVNCQHALWLVLSPEREAATGP